MTIDKSALLAALQPATKTITVDGFGAVNIRQLTVEQSDAARAKATANKGEANSDFGLHLLLVALVDEQGAPVLDDADLHALRTSSGSKVDALVAEVLKANGFVKGDDSGN